MEILLLVLETFALASCCKGLQAIISDLILTSFFSAFSTADQATKLPQLELKSHPCDRKCQSGEEPKTCSYKFEVEYTGTLNKACFNCPLNMTDCYRPECNPTDGFERTIVTVNREIPGPEIVVCKGDTVVVEVLNKLPATTTSVHFHGLFMHGEKDATIGYEEKNPQATPWSDGVPGVTQCPILPGQTFKYKFVANPAGTHWWHSHAALQREDGMYGKFIIKEPDEENIHRNLYDEDLSEHVMIIEDWVHKSGIDMFVPHHWDDGSNKAVSFLINGMGRFKNFGVNKYPGLFTPVEELFVEQGKRYRIRVINAGVSLCPVEMSIEGHTLKVISSDGADIEPIQVKSLVLHNGERYDVVIDTTNKVERTYLIKFGGLMDCGANKIHGTALLKYKNQRHLVDQNKILKGPTKYSSYINIPGKQLNSINRGQGDPMKVSVADMRSARNEILKPADRTIYLSYVFHDESNPEYYDDSLYSFKDVIGKNNLRTPKMNNISLAFPVSPLLSQIEDVDSTMFCNSENLDPEIHCKGGFCSCYHLYQLNYGEEVDVFIIDEGLPWDVSHPFHLHGFHFKVKF